MEIPIELLKKHNLRKTQVRINVLELFLLCNEALSHSDLEAKLEKGVDRVTLYRTLNAFEEKGLIHKAYEGPEQTKYALCRKECIEHEHYDHHAHFHCRLCGLTTCIEELPIPTLPQNKPFQVERTTFLIQGLCNDCQDN